MRSPGRWVVGAPLAALLAVGVASAGALERAMQGLSTVVDLTLPMNGTEVVWGGLEPTGTYLSAPAHIIRGGTTVDKIRADQFIGMAVVVDVRKQVEAEGAYQVSLEDLLAWERKNGKVPKGAVLLLRTGWTPKGETGPLRLPGLSREAADLLLKRQIKGIGMDCLTVDHGSGPEVGVARLLFGAGLYQLGNLANLDKLPPKGARLVVAPLPLAGAADAPARVFAILP